MERVIRAYSLGLLKPNKESKRKIVIGLFLLWGSVLEEFGSTGSSLF